mmetsp:Transcript_27959/g.83787  ORF Transcript_27959/g.83787 Transcript_27959/m.83787 type:complete len:647 (-) Transcript_27959:23-1963(-)
MADVSEAPCAVLTLSAAEWSDADAAVAAFEERAYGSAAPFGRVLDVRLERGAAAGNAKKVRLYFASDAAAVTCAHRFECSGVAVAAPPAFENFEEPPVELSFTDLLPGDDPQTLANTIGGECGEYGRVLDARWEEGAAVIVFASRQGAQAAAIALDGAAFEGRRCACAFATDGGEPQCLLRGVLEEDLDDLSVAEVVGEAEEAARVYGAVSRVRAVKGVVYVVFDENRGAAACAAGMEGRTFDDSTVVASATLRGSTQHEAPAELCAAVIVALTPPEKPPEEAPAKPAPLSEAETLRRAVAALREAVRKAPNDPDLRANLSGALTRVGGVGELEEAVRHGQYAARLKPEWAWGHYRLGAAHFQRGDVGAAAASLKLASSLAPDNASFAELAQRAGEAAEALLDPLDAYAAQAEAEAKKGAIDATAKRAREVKEGRFGQGKKKLEDDDDDVGELLNVNSRAHCYICKQWGHSKKDCPLARCQYCHEIGHRKADCPLFTTALASAAEEEKRARRKQGYENKKRKRKEEWTAMLREQTGVDGFAALYRVLGLPERKLATAAEIKKAYHKRSLMFHPDKNPDDREGAHERFQEVKAAYELLVEGMETGGAGMKGAVFSAGELTDAAAATALQEKVNALAEKVGKSSAWSG